MISFKTIAAIRDRVEIVAVISESVKLTRKGRSYVGLCPFHQEKTPSFNVNGEKGFFYCFGCKEKGTAFDFVMKVDGLTFPEAARRLAAHWFETQLRQHPMARLARDELRRRGLAGPEGSPDDVDARVKDALQAFRVGYAPPGWDGLTNFLAQQGVSPVA